MAAAALLAPALLAATVPPADSPPHAPAATPLRQAFADASARHGVPEDVLLAVSYLESRWDGHGGAPSVAGGYGPMHLTDRLAGTPDAPATLPRAARLTGLAPALLRRDPAANVAGGAALLAELQGRLDLPRSTDPADWYGAVAAYSTARDPWAAREFADGVYDVLRTGERRTTDGGERLELRSRRDVRPREEQRARLGRGQPPAQGRAQCPRTLACEWVPAPYEEFKGDDGQPDYGNHDLARRPGDLPVRYIVVHDTEGSYEGSVQTVQDPKSVSWQYTIRSRDGHVAQHVPLEAVAWHAGNWQINTQSIGIEHEARLTEPDAWFTEAMYRSSARLVRWLARRYDIPLDRQHIIGHDNVPPGDPGSVAGMHTDPGPYWDWAHYFDLLGAPFKATGGSGAVTILPDYAANRPPYIACRAKDDACPPHGSTAVRLHSAPDADSPLVKDAGQHKGEGLSSTGVNDTGARASTGQQFALAGRKGDWTAIWYLGQKAWFHDPAGARTAVPARAEVVTPRAGRESVPVYGRALPEAAAYPEGIKPVEQKALPYELKAGQSYVLGGEMPGEHYYATEFTGPLQRTVVRGTTEYYQIQFGHRLAYVKAADVTVSPAGRAPREAA
ncbi:N-acetylmuramoyl-L-alanine amidase [Streptomyces smaragdinus]|nr:N-acetylmuramoyl-L-alanine amidase [Streptomyces smaragdinus]